MAERMIQVPESLIKRAKEALLELPPSSRNADIYGDLSALLSQPTPSGEPMRTANGTDADHLVQFAERLLRAPLEPWQMRLCRRLFGGNVGRSTGRPDPEPPRIEDLAPGTTFTACLNQAYSDTRPFTYMVTLLSRGKRFVATDGTFWSADQFDPSTIRDVTPPPEVPA